MFATSANHPLVQLTVV